MGINLLLLFVSSTLSLPLSPLLTLTPSLPLPLTCQSPEILTCTVAMVNWDSIITNNTIVLPTGAILTMHNKTRVRGDITAVYGNTEGDRAVLTYHLNTMYGSVETSSGQEFRIETIENTNNVIWAEIDPMMMEDDDDVLDEEPLEPELPHMRTEELLAKGRVDITTMVEYTVSVYYTAGFRKTTADPDTFINQMISLTNEGYANSGVPIRVKLHCVLQSDIPDGLSSSITLRLFTIRQASLNHVRRSADAAILLVNKYNTSKSCGVNWFNSFRNGQTIGTVRKACALGYFSFGHEIAHGFGLAHDRRVASQSSAPYAYGNIIVVNNDQEQLDFKQLFSSQENTDPSWHTARTRRGG